MNKEVRETFATRARRWHLPADWALSSLQAQHALHVEPVVASGGEAHRVSGVEGVQTDRAMRRLSLFSAKLLLKYQMNIDVFK